MSCLVSAARAGGRVLALAIVLAAGVATAQTASISVTRAWARATPPSAVNGAVYLTIQSQEAIDDRLTGLSTPVATKAELHTTSNQGGVMSMAMLDAAPIKAGGVLEMKPGGTHVMLFELKQPLKAGESFPMTLVFEKAGAIQTTVSVEKLGAPDAGGMHDMKM